MKYRKRPVVIEAMQVQSYLDFNPICTWVRSSGGEMTFGQENSGPVFGYLNTLEGSAMTVVIGDWVIRGVAGEFYPCKPDIFALTYDPVVEPEPEFTEPANIDR